MFVRMINPRLVLELGTFTGYSALCLAEGLLDDNAMVHTIEIDDELEDFIRAHFDASEYGSRIVLHIGDAEQIIPTLDTRFDLVFIDANKRDYVAYYEMAMQVLNPGGFIIADNTLWDGKVVTCTEKIDAQTAGILAFNDHVAADDRVEVVIIPLRDGLTIIHKKK